MEKDQGYWAFISYSHRDEKWGRWVHRALETYAVPKRLVGRETRDGQRVPTRITPVFRDREELPTATDLGEVIQSALERSRYMLVICSPASAQSKWVNEEVLAFKRMGKAGRVLALIVDGEPNASTKADADDGLECFPRALMYEVDGATGALSEARTEPIAADARPGKDGKHDALLKVLAGVLGVGFDELKQRDLQRRQRRATALAGGAIALTIVMAALTVWAFFAQAEADRQGVEAQTQRTEAVHQRDAAQQRFNELRALSNTLIFDLHDEIKALPGAVQARRTLIQTGLKYLEVLASEAQNDPVLALEVATGFQRMGNVQAGFMEANLGDLDAALASHRRSLSMRRAVLEHHPDGAAPKRSVAASLTDIGDMLLQMGQTEEALRNYRDALTIAEPLAEQMIHPIDLHHLSAMHERLSKALLRLGRSDEALTHAERAVEVAERLNHLKPGSAKYLDVLFNTSHQLAFALAQVGRTPDAIGAYEAVLSVTDRQAELAPDSVDPLRARLVTLGDLALQEMRIGETERAAERCAEALKLAERLYERDPTNTVTMLDLAEAHSKQGTLLSQTEQYNEALAAHERALALKQRLVERSPSSVEYRRELAGEHGRLGKVLTALKRTDDAQEYFKKQHAFADRLIDSAPGDTSAMQLRATTYYKQAMAAFSAKDVVGAERAHAKCIEVLDQLIRIDPDNAQYRTDLRTNVSRRATCLLNMRRLDEAFATYNRALDIARQLAEDHPENPAHAVGEMGMHFAIGNAYGFAAGKVDDASRLEYWKNARAAYREALKIAEAMEAAGTLAQRDRAAAPTFRKRIEACDKAIAELER